MSPEDRKAHWRDYRIAMSIVLATAIGAPLVFHIVLTIARAVPWP